VRNCFTFPEAGFVRTANHRLAGRGYSLPYLSRYRDRGRSMNRPVPKLVASSTVECLWPSFDGTKLPLSQPARQQLSRVYSDFRNNPTLTQRKSGLLRWIYFSAFDPVKGIHLPVSETVKTSGEEAINRSKFFACTPLNFPEMPPVPRFFSNALVVGTEKPSLRGTNAGLIVVTHEIDTESLTEFEHVLASTRGREGDFNKSPFADLNRRLCGCREYRGYSIVYSGRRSLHFHSFFQTKHLINAPWEANSSQRIDAGHETAALMQNAHNIYWDHARTVIEEILDPPRPVDLQMHLSRNGEECRGPFAQSKRARIVRSSNWRRGTKSRSWLSMSTFAKERAKRAHGLCPITSPYPTQSKSYRRPRRNRLISHRRQTFRK